MRPETGPMQFPGDWPGVFLRGDNAIPYSAYLAEIIALLVAGKPLQVRQIAKLHGLRDLLCSCHAGKNPECQHARLNGAIDATLIDPVWLASRDNELIEKCAALVAPASNCNAAFAAAVAIQIRALKTTQRPSANAANSQATSDTSEERSGTQESKKGEG